MGTICANSKKKMTDFLIAALVTIIGVVIFVLFFGRPRITNDQVLMRDIISGVYTGKPEGHSIFIMYTLGFLLSSLYRICAVFPWYDCFMFGVFPLSLFCFLYYGNGKFSSWLGKIVFTVAGSCLFIMPFLWFIVQNEFDVDAGVLSVAAVFCLFCCEKDAKLSKYILPIILYVFSAWIRKEVFYMLLPITAIVVLWKLIVEKDKRIWRPIAVLGVLILASLSIEAVAYSSPEWKAFSKYNVARSKLYDFYGFPPYESLSNVADEYGITEDDYTIFTNSMGLCEKIDADALDAIAKVAAANNATSIKECPDVVWNKLVKNVQLEYVRVKKNSIGRLMIVLSALLIVISAVNLLIKKKLTELFCLIPWILLLGYAAVFAVYFIFIGRYPERISLPLYMALIVVMVGLLVSQINNLSTSSMKKVLSIVPGTVAGICIVFASVYGTNNLLWEMSEYSDFRNDCILRSVSAEEYCAKNPSNIYYLHNGITSYRGDRLFVHATETAPNSITLCYWTLYSPLFETRKENLGLSKLSYDLLNKENVFFLSEDFSYISWLYALNPSSIEIVDKFDDGVHFYYVYSIRK